VVVKVCFLKENLTFTGDDSPMATLLLSVMGGFAEFERALIRERQREGIAIAKAKGVYLGRKPALRPQQADELVRRADNGESKSTLARGYGISRDRLHLSSSGGSLGVRPHERGRASAEHYERSQLP
jgi:DNA invertase Pin-like site-specific DNA recombinase